MVVQAAAANDVFEARPERAREALQAIEATGRSALAELRRLLGVVRADGAEYTPQPGLDGLDELVAQVRAAGLAVAISVEGAPRPLPAGIDLSAYRVVQEALTNTLKHADASRADVALRYGEDTFDVEVRDDGTGNGNGGGSGSGLIGMRERVVAFGGSCPRVPAPAAASPSRRGSRCDPGPRRRRPAARAQRLPHGARGTPRPRARGRGGRRRARRSSSRASSTPT